MKKALYIIRTESDFERVVTLAISAKNRYKQSFIFVGDFSPFYNDGIANTFQKFLMRKHGFFVKDFCDFDLLGNLLKKLSNSSVVTFKNCIKNKKLLFQFIFFTLFSRYLEKIKSALVKKIFEKVDPDVLLMDQALINDGYLPEMFRREALLRNIPVCIFTHGAAGGLHSAFSEPNFLLYDGCFVFVCNKNETDSSTKNRIVLGDVSSSFPNVHYINAINENNISFQNEKKYKIGIFMPGIGPYTSTSGWKIIEEIIIDLSEDINVSMVLKLHPRETEYIDLRMLKTFKNLLLVNKECDRSRVTKWANIIICGDHCSTIFEPMILGKKVVAVEGRHIPKFKYIHSPIKYSSITHISSADEFDLDQVSSANPMDKVTNEICWGNHGSIDLAELLFNKVNKLDGV